MITHVAPQSDAYRAGIRAGDRIDIAATRPEYRIPVVSGEDGSSLPGQRLTIAVVRGATRQNISFVTAPEEMDTATVTLIVARELAMLVFIGVGAMLLLLRPSLATWGFYFYCLGLNGAPTYLVQLLVGAPWNLVLTVAPGLLIGAGYVGVAVFAVSFLHEPPAGWRAVACYVAPFVLLVMWSLIICSDLGSYWFGWPVRILSNAALGLSVAVALLAMCAFVETYVGSRGTDRQRIRWVVVGFGISLAAIAAVSIVATRGGNPPYWLWAGLMLVGVVAPLTVAYAVIKYRIIDVSFVVSRAVVYGILTTLLVGVFSVIDWFFGGYLRLARLGTIAEVGAVVAFGMWFKGLHGRVDTLIDATFFRQRHIAEVRLARVAAALPLAATTNAVTQLLVSEPAQAMSLASVALFRRGSDGVFVREGSEGWDDSHLSALDEADESLLALVQAEGGPLSLDSRRWRTESLPSGPAHPVVALPIIVRRELIAIVFYGSHIHGEALDPDEVKGIAGLSTGAAAAYDHLEAEALRREIESIKRKNETLQTELAEAQIQPA